MIIFTCVKVLISKLIDYKYHSNPISFYFHLNFCADLSANFENISKDMAKKLDVKDAKKGWFNKQMEF